jgi:hypothetical protein
MIGVQDKPAVLAAHAGGDRCSAGSVPAVMPLLQAGARSTSAMSNSAILSPTLYDEIASLLLIVVAPAAFWCGIIVAVRSLIGLETSNAALSCIGLVIAGFLLVIRASLMIDRSGKAD